MIEAAVFGYGNIGSGVVTVIEENQDRIEKAVGERIHVKYVLDLRDFEGDPIQSRVVHDVETILNDPEIRIIAETMGGNEPAYTFTKKALEKGKSVCTSNKELVANHGAELIRIAAENNCSYLFEASVGGGIPVIRVITEALLQERIMDISGIVNGTTNYILTKMGAEGMDFDTALTQAQVKGYAERNPEADVEGYDAVRKIAILSSLMSGKTVDYKKIYTEGITKIAAEDFEYAKKRGGAIKLVASSRISDEGFDIRVAPVLLPGDHPLCGVNDVFNGIFIKGNMLDDSMYYGRGAGKLPTASAVVADILQCARHLGKHIDINWSEEEAKIANHDKSKSRFFIRLDESKCSEKNVTDVFGTGETIRCETLKGEFGFVTPDMTEAAFAEKKATIDGLLGMLRVVD